MGKYCVNCGKVLHAGARFCAQCGGLVLDAPASSALLVQPKPVLQSQSNSELQPQFKTEAQPQRHTRPVVTPKRSGGHNALCIVLSVLLLMQIAAVAFYGWPGLAVGGKEGGPAKVKSLAVLESESFTLQEGQTSIKTDSG